LTVARSKRSAKRAQRANALRTVTYEKRVKSPLKPAESRYIWIIRIDGRVVGSSASREAAKALVKRLLTGAPAGGATAS
jgi:hypothetical protein